MNNTDFLERVKRLTISALVADDILMGILVLKGGNALNIAYNITNRGSIDIDFSMEKDFSPEEKKRLQNQVESLLSDEFKKENLVPFDINLTDRPQKIHDSVKSFWGGYLLEFKVIEKDKFESFDGNINVIRRNAIALHTNNSTKFTVDISKYEYVAQKRPKDIEGAVVYVYSPEMLALEKLRAICQQSPDYKDIIISKSQKSRARDFYDIYNLVESYSINFHIPENIELCKNIFDAKRVPYNFIKDIVNQKEFHRESWESVVNTVSFNEELKDFDYYFDFVVEQFKDIF